MKPRQVILEVVQRWMWVLAVPLVAILSASAVSTRGGEDATQPPDRSVEHARSRQPKFSSIMLEAFITLEDFDPIRAAGGFGSRIVLQGP